MTQDQDCICCMYICVRVCCIHMHACMHMYACTCVCMYLHMVYMHTHVHVCDLCKSTELDGSIPPMRGDMLVQERGERGDAVGGRGRNTAESLATE